MGIENIKETPLKSLEKRKEIPLSWFVAVGTEKEGIQRIIFSDELKNLGGVEFEEWMFNYKNHMKFASFEDRSPQKFSNEEKEHRNDQIQFSEELVRLKTGFTAGEIWQRQRELEQNFKGQKEAPIILKFS